MNMLDRKYKLNNFMSLDFVEQSFAERSIRQLKKASLKDLRPEDKKRIADLIKELARYVFTKNLKFLDRQVLTNKVGAALEGAIWSV